MKTGRFHQYQKQYLHDLSRIGFQCRTLPVAGQNNTCRFEETELTWGCTVFQCDLWFMTTFTGARIPLTNPVLPNPNTQQQALSWWEVPPTSPRAPFVRDAHHPLLCHRPENHTPLVTATKWIPLSSHLKDPCSFSRACFHLAIQKHNTAELKEQASPVGFVSRQ